MKNLQILWMLLNAAIQDKKLLDDDKTHHSALKELEELKYITLSNNMQTVTLTQKAQEFLTELNNDISDKLI